MDSGASLGAPHPPVFRHGEPRHNEVRGQTAVPAQSGGHIGTWMAGLWKDALGYSLYAHKQQAGSDHGKNCSWETEHPWCCQLRRPTVSATSRQPQPPQDGPGLSVHAHKHKMGTEVHRHVGTQTHCPCAATQRRGSSVASIQCPDGLRSAWVTLSHPSSIFRTRVPT